MTDFYAHYQRLERAYHEAPCNSIYRPKLTVSAGGAKIRLQVAPTMHHAAGAVHGSYYFKMLDDAAYFAANSLVQDALVLTASFSLEFLRPVVGGEMKAKGRVRRFGKTLIFAESTLLDEDGNELATGRGTFTRSKVAIPGSPRSPG